MPITLQKGIDPATQDIIWLVLDENYQVIEPIQRYLTFLCGIKSPNTVESYGYSLKAWWEFLQSKNLDWKEVKLTNLEDFVYWLRVGDISKIVSMQPIQAKRSERSINLAVTAVTTFYEYHIAHHSVDSKTFDRLIITRGTTRRGFLDGISKSKPTRQKLVKLKEPKKFPGCLTDEQIEILVNSCHRLRDKFLILLLNGTGIRIGELLGLQHEDIGDGNDYFIYVRKRRHSHNVRAKGQERTIPVIPELLQMYNNYLIYEYPEVESNYVFVNIWEGEIGMPMKQAVINTMFARLSKKTGIKVHPHLFRHSYATRLLKNNCSPDRVKYLLGHSSIQTTLDVYSHVIAETDLRVIIEEENNYRE
ncbi:MAG: tyrosine-type recombinase/integrase [Crinalium sp.]|uniref:Integrase family protein n=1 Tax=Crinalium epipsammum PCC 9333 TaxID=1173022 RepID=K9VV23_9CYAN|nr:tyrosine-type recombinase/integrase [Crinalium epipsammum]AFZ11409.1 integrase family protein [Crinalium epipsammum PCC 9333]